LKNRIPIIVLTPVKNEEWILRNFLSSCSLFADKIIVIDQNSTDGTIEILKSFNKVVTINNPDDSYNEALRQKMLITKARELNPGKKLLVALDADEIVAGNSLLSSDWDYMVSRPPGTTFSGEKIELLYPGLKYVRHNPPDFMEFAFVDDGISVHEGTMVHSYRLPKNSKKSTIHLSNFKIIHFSRFRDQLYWDKLAYYSMIENINGSDSFVGRIGRNSKRIYLLNEPERTFDTPTEWIKPSKELHGIDMEYLSLNADNNIRLKILNLFQEYGEKRFYYEDIWDVNWNDVAQQLNESNKFNESFQIKGPQIFHKCVTCLIIFLWKMKKTIRSFDKLTFWIMNKKRF
jgi:glycosyltransferase involved in cell wall biosynthesis